MYLAGESDIQSSLCSLGGQDKHFTFELAEKSATGKVERRWLGLFVAATGALAIFAPRSSTPPLRARSHAADPPSLSFGVAGTAAATARQEPLTIDT